MILDNVTNASAPLSDRKEMSIYMDDVVVYSPMSSADNECGGNCSGDGRLPLDYTSAPQSTDKTAPIAAIQTPSSGAAVTGMTTVTVNASDNVGVTKVEFYVNGVLKNTETVAPYSFSWDTAAIANGSYTLSAKSYDAAGNIGQSSSISVTVNNPAPDTKAPLVSLTAPVNKSTVKGTITVSASASDSVGVSRIDFYLNGTLRASVNVSPYSFNWDTKTVANGSNRLMAKAFDAAGNAGTCYIDVSVSNPVPDTTPPTVTVTSPSSGAMVGGTTSITAGASDNVGVAKVEFYVNGILKATDSASPYAYSWDTKAVTDGSHILLAKAYDAAGNVGLSSGIAVTVKNTIPDTSRPGISILTPVDKATVNGTVQVRSYAVDNVGVKKVEYYVNGGLKSTLTASPYSYSWDTRTAANGSCRLLAKAYDAAGNMGTYYVNVSVKNTASDTSRPGISILTPADRATIGGIVQVTSYAVDNVGVRKVEYYVNGVLKSTATASPYSYSWDTRTAADGSCRLLAKAYDAAGNIGNYYINLTIKN
jgi:hypothetical protein